MEISAVELVKLINVLESLGLDNGCTDGTCENCKIQAILQRIPRYKDYLFQIMVVGSQTNEDFLYPMHMAFLHGFLLAWEYRNTLELERMNSL